MITPSRPAKIVVATGRTNCRLSVVRSGTPGLHGGGQERSRSPSAARPSWYPTMCSSRAEPGRWSGAPRWETAKSKPYSGCPPAYSTPKGSRQTCCSSSVGPGRCGGHPGAVDLRPADQPALHPEGQSPATPPHHPKQHREKPRLPEPNFIKPRGFQDDCFFHIFNSFKPTHEPSTWPTLPPPITGVPLSRTRRRWRNLPLRRRTCLAIPAARRSCLLRRPAHPW